ncbi:hypothetical protein [Roseibium sp.]|uniref:hypothetical protein n=1 Tax=Roseibium sp. TaxID=1936156 RepID=UPI003A982F6B
MQLSIETTTQSASIFTSSTGAVAMPSPKGAEASDEGSTKAPVLSALENAAKKAEDDAVVIAALQEAVEKGKGGTDDEGQKSALAKMDEYRETAGKLKSALGEDGGSSASISYESATISTTTIEAEINGETVSAEFISIERVSFNNETGLSVRTASAANIDADLGNISASYQSASVSSLYAGTGDQVGNLIAGLA